MHESGQWIILKCCVTRLLLRLAGGRILATTFAVIHNPARSMARAVAARGVARK
jgi:hypothetical protein